MSIIHRTTLKPTKLELLAGWLPSRPWYQGGADTSLVKGGGFRLDDPAGEVGIEFMVAADGSAAYHVPLTYRGSPLDEIGDALVGTTEHGVLGTRWVYDGTRDPVLVSQLAALIQGTAVPQAQSLSDTPDPTVLSWPAADAALRVDGFTVADDANSTIINAGELALRVRRLLEPVTGDVAAPGAVSAIWSAADGSQVRGIFATAESGHR